MNRRRKTIAFLYWLLLSAVSALAQQTPADDKIEATPLAAGLYLLEGAGGNVTASIGSDGVFLVDDDMAAMSDKLLSKLKELGGDAPRLIVNTHFHYDHSGGNAAFGSRATIVAAAAVRDRLMTEQTLWRQKHAPVPRAALPLLTFERELQLHINGHEVRVVHLPHAHTDGDTVVIFDGGNLVSAGDLYFAGMFPIFHPEHQGGLQGLLKATEFLLTATKPDGKIVPGHGPVTGRSELQAYATMLQVSLSTVRRGVRRNLSLAQIQKAGLPVSCEPFSHGFLTTDQWIAALYKSLRTEHKAPPIKP